MKRTTRQKFYKKYVVDYIKIVRYRETKVLKFYFVQQLLIGNLLFRFSPVYLDDLFPDTQSKSCLVSLIHYVN